MLLHLRYAYRVKPKLKLFTYIIAQRPTLLAKIFGVYKIAYKNPILGRVVRMNLLVMENLFYGRRFTRVRSREKSRFLANILLDI
jgi:hypothetical protein